VLTLGVICAMSFAVTGCGSDGDAAGDTTSTTDSSAPQQRADNEFAVLVADLMLAVARAGDDLCLLDSAVPERPLEPRSSPQAGHSLGLHTVWLDAVADALTARGEPGAEALQQTAAQLMESGVGAGFPTEFWTEASTQQLLQNPEYLAAIQRVDELTADCGNDQMIAEPVG
jgi:hypothetical protein